MKLLPARFTGYDSLSWPRSAAEHGIALAGVLARMAGMATCVLVLSPAIAWEVTFGTQGRPAIADNEEPRLVTDPSGERFYLHNFGRNGIDPTVVRMDATGNMSWSNASARSTSPSTTRVTPLSDGSLVVATQELQLLAADGTQLWTVPWPTAFDSALVFEMGGDLVVIDPASGVPVTRIERSSGRALERTGVGSIRRCMHGRGAVGGNALYFVTDGDPGCGALVKVGTAPLRVEWVVPDAGAEAVALLADHDGAYLGRWVAGEYRVEKRSSVGGSVIWSVPGPLVVPQPLPNRAGLVMDVDGDVISHAAKSVDKLDRATGARRWRHPIGTGLVVGIAVSEEAIVIARTDTDGSALSPIPGHVARLRRSDGASLWQSALPPLAGSDGLVTGVAVGNAGILATGTSCAPAARPFVCQLALWPTTLGGSVAKSLLAELPLPSSDGHAVPAGGDTTVAGALEWGSAGRQLRVRRIRNADGTVLWDSVRPAAFQDAPASIPWYTTVAATDTTDGTVAAVYSSSPGGWVPPISDAVVVVFDGATGAFRWERSVVDRRAGYTDGFASVVAIDRSGNVLVPLHEAQRQTFLTPYVPNRRLLRKYSALNGDVLFGVDFPPVSGGAVYFYSPPHMRMIGDDVLVGEVPGSATAFALTRIAGADGQVVWSNPAIDYSLAGRVDAIRSYAAIDIQSIGIAAHALASGDPAWTTSYTHPADRGYALASMHVGGDGAVYAGGYRNVPRPGSSSATDRRGLLMRIEASDGTLSWVDLVPTTPVKSSNDAIRPFHDRDGVVYARQSQARSYESNAEFFTGFSSADASLRGTQLVALANGAPATGGVIAGNVRIIGSTADHGLIMATQRVKPGSPARYTVTKLPPPGVFAGGSLRVSLATTIESGDDGMRRARFVFDAINDGTIPAADTDVLLEFPASSIAQEVTCTTNGSSCVPVITATSIGFHGDVAAGARVRISGMLDTVAALLYRPELAASALAPYGFIEMDMKDNTRSFPLGEGLFLQGFD